MATTTNNDNNNTTRDDATFLNTIEIYYTILIIGICVYEFIRKRYRIAYLNQARLHRLFDESQKIIIEKNEYESMQNNNTTTMNSSTLMNSRLSSPIHKEEAEERRYSNNTTRTSNNNAKAIRDEQVALNMTMQEEEDVDGGAVQQPSPTELTPANYIPTLNSRANANIQQKQKEEFQYLFKEYGFLQWIPSFLKVSDEHIFTFYGIESLFYLRFQRLCMKLSICCIICSFLLLPLYATGNNNAKDSSGNKVITQILQKLSLANVPANGIRLIGSILCLYIISFYCFYLVYQEYIVYTKYRHRYMKLYRPEQYTIVISDVLYHLRSTFKLKEYMDYLFPNQVYQITMPVNTSELDKVAANREKIRDKLEEAIVTAYPDVILDTDCLTSSHSSRHHITSKSETRPLTGTRNYNVSNKIESYERDLSEMNLKYKNAYDGVCKKIENQEIRFSSTSEYRDPNDNNSFASRNIKRIKEKVGPKDKSLNVAFVSFTTIRAKQILTQALQNENTEKMSVSSAPHRNDIIWPNMMNTTFKLRSAARMASYVATAWIVFFWTVPTTFVSSLANIYNLRQSVKFIDKLLKNYPSLTGLFEQLGPLSIVVMGILVKVIFDNLSHKEKHYSQWKTRVSLLLKLTSYNLVQSFFIFAISGSVLSQLERIINTPNELLKFLGTSLPGQAIFFITVIVVQTNLGLILELLRVVPIAKHLLYSKFAPKKTPRQRRSPWLFGLQSLNETEEFDPTSNYADNIFVFVLLMTYAVISPILSYFAFLNFLISDIVFRRQIFTVYETSHHSYGAYWRKLYNFMIAALILSQLTLIGYFGIKKSPGAAAATIVLLVTTLIYHSYIKDRFTLASLYLPLNHCIQVDNERKMYVTRIGEILHDEYVQPAFKIPMEIHAELYENQIGCKSNEEHERIAAQEKA